MKLLLLLIVFTFGFAADTDFTQVDSLSSAKQYVDAMNALENLQGDEIEIAIKKSQFALDYFVTSMNHQLFAFKNMEHGETVESIRGQTGSFTMFMIPVDSMMYNLIKKFPDDPRPYKMLGDFYYDVHWKYPQWHAPDSLVLENAVYGYMKAAEQKALDSDSYHNCGVALSSLYRFEESLIWFRKSIEKDSQYASAYYNLAYSLSSLGDYTESNRNAQKAFELYEAPALKADAAKIIGMNCIQTEEYVNAFDQYKMATQVNPDDYWASYYLIQLYFQTGDSLGGIAYTPIYFAFDPTNPTISSNINDFYFGYGFQRNLKDVWLDIAQEYKDNDEALGNVYFHLARALWDQEDIKQAKSYFKKARKHFEEICDKDHEVFQVISDVLEKL